MADVTIKMNSSGARKILNREKRKSRLIMKTPDPSGMAYSLIIVHFTYIFTEIEPPRPIRDITLSTSRKMAIIITSNYSIPTLSNK